MIKAAVDDEDETVVERDDYLDEFCKVSVRCYWRDVCCQMLWVKMLSVR